MPFKTERLSIPEVLLISPGVFKDDRGFFEETYKLSEFRNFGLDVRFVQDNHSFSVKNTLRGIHFQKPPFVQGKLVRCVNGKVLDVAVDLRSGSPSFGKWVSEELSAENHNILWIPEGFGHGFLALEDAHVEYKVTAEYSKDSEGGIIWNDSILDIAWGLTNPVLSMKDASWPTVEATDLKFNYKPGESIK